jgi:hypothetical protein
MSSKLHAFLNTLGFAVVLFINTIASVSKINGYNTGEISDFYPNYFVPAGFTFSIWSVIYVMIIGFVICSIAATGKKMADPVKEVIKKVSPYFQVTCILNIGWILTWQYLYLPFSLFIMLTFLLTLIFLYIKIRRDKNTLTPFYRFWVYHTFLVYLAWICVATIANFTALFIKIGWHGSPLREETWSIIMIVIALVFGIFFVGRRKEPAYGFVLCWAFFGIYAKQITAAKDISNVAALSICILLALNITILIKTRRAKA